MARKSTLKNNGKLVKVIKINKGTRMDSNTIPEPSKHGIAHGYPVSGELRGAQNWIGKTLPDWEGQTAHPENWGIWKDWLLVKDGLLVKDIWMAVPDLEPEFNEWGEVCP